MNLEDRESESRPGIATQVQAPKHSFEWPDDKRNLALSADSIEKRTRSEHFSAWVAFWCMTWAGTTFAGSLFGGVLGLIGIASNPAAPFFGLFYGGIWAGAVGLFVFVHLGAICWTFWWLETSEDRLHRRGSNWRDMWFVFLLSDYCTTGGCRGLRVR